MQARITQYVNYFRHPAAQRQMELDESLRRNLENPAVDCVTVLTCSKARRQIPFSSPKLQWAELSTDRRVTFREMFAEVNRRVSSPDEISVISNADIAFDGTLGAMREYDLEGVCLCLSRWELRNGQAPVQEAWDNSQDAWVFQGRIRPLFDIDYPLGIFGCDNRLAWELAHADYCLANPCYDIMSYHLHDSGYRDNGTTIPGSTQVVPRSGLRELNLPPKRPSRAGLIAFSLFGKSGIYPAGAIENVKLARYVYPGWTIRFYVDNSISEAVTKLLKSHGADVVGMPRSQGLSGTFWRFLAADDPGFSRWMVRDVDSRLGYRERRAVDEWIESGSPFHIIRDHPWHRRAIMGCSFGGIRGVVPMLALLEEWRAGHHSCTEYCDDEEFLERMVWPRVKDVALIHDSHGSYDGNSHPLPGGSEFGRFVGEKIYEDEHGDHGPRDAKMLALRNALVKPGK